jgi:hypothetical protein
VNNNIDSILRQVQSFEIFKLYLSDQLSEFVQEFEHSWNTISQDRNLRNSLNNKIFRKWFSGKNPQLMSDDGELNPLVLAYYLTDVLISNQYNEFMIGNSYNHKIKYTLYICLYGYS